MRFRGQWTTRLGFYLAAIGSAFGLGNLWRFPYVVAENGGGAFVLLYLFLAFLIGIPILVAELILGKTTQQSIIGALAESLKDNPSHRRIFVKFGQLAVFSSLAVLSYYAVISGWVLHFFMRFTIGMFDSAAFDASQALAVLQESGLLQVALASVHILVTVVIVMKGVQNGLEKWVGYTMPIFAVLLIVLVAKSLSLPTSGKALRFLFYPDFTKLSISSLGHAIGHVLFTLSVGFGIMVTFGSYMRKDVRVPEAGLRVALLDTGISLIVGMVIFPILLAGVQLNSGPEMLFQTLPKLFERFSGGHLYGVGFFLCLYLASLTASIGLLEALVSNLGDRWGWSRRNAAMVGGGLSFGVAIIPALSSSVLSNIRWAGMSVLELTDVLIINWLLPVVALGVCLVVARKVERKTKEQEFLSPIHPEEMVLFNNWQAILQWIAPILIVSALVLQVYGLFRN
jgi:NSS family neurotransmitter:Na+ symporter